MPGGNGTGPMGAGPMTGRGAGFCAGYGVPGYANCFGGRGFFGRGRGFGGGGRGRRNMYYMTGLPGWARAGYGWTANDELSFAGQMTAKDELDMLKNQAQGMEDTLESIKDRIEQIESGKTAKQ